MSIWEESHNFNYGEFTIIKNLNSYNINFYIE